jgi:ABC-type multidrug transport system fused ATPase/permease subunit
LFKKIIIFLKEIFLILSFKDRLNFLLINCLFIFWSFFEILSISFLGLFLKISTDTQYLNQANTINKVFFFLGVNNQELFILISASFLILFMIVSSLLGIVSNWKLVNYICHISYTKSSALYKYFLTRPRIYYLVNSKSQIMKKMNSDFEIIIYQTFIPLINIFSKFFITLFIFIFILIINPLISSILIFSFIFFYLIFFKFIKKNLRKNSVNIEYSNQEKSKIINESFSGIKEIILSNSYKSFIEKYDFIIKKINFNSAEIIKLSQLPRGLAELISVIIVIIIFIILLKLFNNDLLQIIPLLGMFAFAGYKIIPAIQSIFQSISVINGSLASFDSIKNDLLLSSRIISLDEELDNSIQLNQMIFFNKVFFKFPKKNQNTLEDINITINRNNFISIYGKNGSGKSTIINILLGLLIPSSGSVYVDQNKLDESNLVSWRKTIGFVSQDIFLFDDTIINNIIFGLEKKPSTEEIQNIIEISGLKSFVSNLPDKLNTIVGENGINLSGGQKQKIAIARCLVKNPEIIILDEATSSLDISSEKIISEMIKSYRNKKTIILISHKVNLIKDSDVIYFLEKGKIIDFGNYNDLLKNKNFVKNL